MTEKLQAIRGMNDILPQDSSMWQWLEAQFVNCVSQYGYQEIRLPLVESTQLFKRTIGEATDVVEKEMYTFADLNGESISLRPEGTAGTVRACLEHGLLYHQQQRLWYIGPMFRHEKPQKGRYRQFHHFGVEVFGMAGPAIELELLSLCMRLWKQLKIDTALQLEINTLGTLEERQTYRARLVAYLLEHESILDEDSKRRLTRNPLRILDSKNPAMQTMLEGAPALLETLGAESRAHFDEVCQGLDALGIPYKINPRLVRGLDYYGHTAFEWVTDQLGSQSTVCGGGRYDSLVSHLGGQPTPAVGFGMGAERILLLLQTLNLAEQKPAVPDIFMVVESTPIVMNAALKLAEEIRTQYGMVVVVNVAGGSFKSQFKKADKSGAPIALVMGVSEAEANQVGLKHLREMLPQTLYSRDALMEQLGSLVKKEGN